MQAPAFSAALGRALRQDAPADLGVPTPILLEAAVSDGRTDDALAWLDYYLTELRQVRDIFVVWNWHLVQYILRQAPDDTWAQVLDDSLAPWLATTAGVPGQPVASVAVEGRQARLVAPGLSDEIWLTETETQRYELTLGSPTAQADRWATWQREMRAAITGGERAAVRRLLDRQTDELRLFHDILADWAWALLSLIVHRWGEACLGEVLRVTEEPWVSVRYASLAQLSAEESLRLTVEGMRGHLGGPGRTGQVEVVEEAERYVLSFDACGTGGRMRRGDPLVGSPSRLAPPYNFVNITGAYPWTWQRTGVCAYCAHCAVVNQMLPIAGLGRPMRQTLYPDDANQACQWVIYKDPAGYPDAAFTSVGCHR